jgi:methyl-accepting chemotaxis protein
VEEATRLALDNASAAEEGSKCTGEVVSTMEGLNAASDRIGDIINTIEGIACKTNLRALDAAVEAARASEQGRGFAVVASEVRAPAQRAAAAAGPLREQSRALAVEVLQFKLDRA